VAATRNCSAGALGYGGKNERNSGGVVACAWWGSSAEREEVAGYLWRGKAWSRG
jgi:hypothetical protein